MSHIKFKSMKASANTETAGFADFIYCLYDNLAFLLSAAGLN